VSHLFFADDSIIFCKAKKEEAIQLKAIFDEYQRISGQLINMAKSEMTFSPNIQPAIKDDFKGILPFNITSSILKYLGMPTQIG
jgi:predicted RNA-binding protein